MSYAGAEPSVEEIEAEFWRIVETPDDVYESLYGQVRVHIQHGRRSMRLFLLTTSRGKQLRELPAS